VKFLDFFDFELISRLLPLMAAFILPVMTRSRQVEEPLLGFDGATARRLREEKGLSPGQVAKAVGRSSGTMQMYEYGESCPPADVVCKIAYVLDVPLMALFKPTQPLQRLARPEPEVTVDEVPMDEVLGPSRQRSAPSPKRRLKRSVA
jgi:transcriptional regulator with XRE-family HTH domain